MKKVIIHLKFTIEIFIRTFTTFTINIECSYLEKIINVIDIYYSIYSIIYYSIYIVKLYNGSLTNVLIKSMIYSV